MCDVGCWLCCVMLDVGVVCDGCLVWCGCVLVGLFLVLLVKEDMIMLVIGVGVVLLGVVVFVSVV